MKTPGLIEALFQIDARADAKLVCSAWTYARDVADCLQRQYPFSMSADGVLILKIAAGVLLFAALWGVVGVAMYVYSTRPLPSSWQLVMKWLAQEVFAAMWFAWKAMMVFAFVVILVQVLFA